MQITSETQVLEEELLQDRVCRVLALDGGGSKGFYTLGVLKEIEAKLGCPLHERFDLIFGTSTGAIIASLLCLGYKVDDIHDLYKKHVPTVMRNRSRKNKSSALAQLAVDIFGNKTFEDVLTGIGIVATQWATEKPLIFKASSEQAHGRKETFKAGFGVRIAEAVQASCSAFPYFDRKTIKKDNGDLVELIDGGYCANNPTLYAIAEAVQAFKIQRDNIRVVSVGVGVYPEPKSGLWMKLAKRYLVSVPLLQKTLEINTQSMEQLRKILFNDVQTIRISDIFESQDLATGFMEHDLVKLNRLRQCGSESFAPHEADLKKFLKIED
jgi:uncharacterized protein